MAEQRSIQPEEIAPDFPRKIVELLSQPTLTNLPEHPVGLVLDILRGTYTGFTQVELPEVVDIAKAREIVADAVYVEAAELHRIDERRILRYDLTLPLLVAVSGRARPHRLWAAGKVYRLGRVDATHLESFHQAEVFCLDERTRFDPWSLTGQVLHSIDAVLPGRAVKIVPTRYPMCSQAWELEVEDDGRWLEVMAWGVFTDAIVRFVGGDPARDVAMGIGYGLERLAMLRYGIDDVRKVDAARVA